MEHRGQDVRSANADEESKAKSWLKVSATDFGFIAFVLVISGAAGVAFESALAAGLLAVFGGMAAWAVWKEFQHRVLHRKEPER